MPDRHSKTQAKLGLMRGRLVASADGRTGGRPVGERARGEDRAVRVLSGFCEWEGVGLWLAEASGHEECMACGSVSDWNGR